MGSPDAYAELAPWCALVALGLVRRFRLRPPGGARGRQPADRPARRAGRGRL